MLQTPLGMRCPDAPEMIMLSYGASRLSAHLNERICAEARKDAHDGVVIKPVKESSTFHSLTPKQQLVVLHGAITNFFHPDNHAQMTQMWNSALECVYSCLFYEIKREIEMGRTPHRRSIRQFVYTNHEYYDTERKIRERDRGDKPSLLHNINPDSWLRCLDKLAAHTVFEHKFSEQFNLGGALTGDDLEVAANHAAAYFEAII